MPHQNPKRFITERINQSLQREQAVRKLFSVDVPLLDDIIFYQQLNFHGYIWGILGFTFLFLFVAVHLPGIFDFSVWPYQVHLTLLVLEILCLLPLRRDRYLNKRFHDKNQRWGIFITEDLLTIRQPEKEVFITRRMFVSVNLVQIEKSTLLQIQYRPSRHLDATSISLHHVFKRDNRTFDRNKKQMLNDIENWQQNPPQKNQTPTKYALDMEAEEAWSEKLREIYRYRSILPNFIIRAIPEFPCSVEEQMNFINSLKPYQNRMQFMDKMYRIILLGFVVLNGFVTYTYTDKFLYSVGGITNIVDGSIDIFWNDPLQFFYLSWSVLFIPYCIYAFQRMLRKEPQIWTNFFFSFGFWMLMSMRTNLLL